MDRIDYDLHNHPHSPWNKIETPRCPECGEEMQCVDSGMVLLYFECFECETEEIISKDEL